MNKYSLYVVTDEGLSNGRSHAEIARMAVQGGAGAVQLRDKKMSSAELYAAALEITEVCKNRAVFIVNDRLDVALAAGADGVHLGQDDLPLKAARAIAPPGFIIGLSVSSVEEALLAARDGAGYVAVSPVFDTASKADAGTGQGLGMVSAIRRALPNDIPVIGIGGLSEANIPQAISAGADGIAVISAVVSSPDIRAATERLLGVIRRAESCIDN
ncbi:MAG: thiamine phosphate synthase [Leptospirales bacterium]|nr:thiamine phosphate synthase [Leptospirales bacterium]